MPHHPGYAAPCYSIPTSATSSAAACCSIRTSATSSDAACCGIPTSSTTSSDAACCGIPTSSTTLSAPKPSAARLGAAKRPAANPLQYKKATTFAPADYQPLNHLKPN